jgi:hypothetical protein
MKPLRVAGIILGLVLSSAVLHARAGAQTRPEPQDSTRVARLMALGHLGGLVM